MTRPKNKPAAAGPIELIPSLAAVVDVLRKAGRPLRYAQLAEALAVTPGTLRARLQDLRRLGIVKHARTTGAGGCAVWRIADHAPEIRPVTAEEMAARQRSWLQEGYTRWMAQHGLTDAQRPKPDTPDDDSIDSWPVKRRALAAGSWRVDHPVGVRSVFELAHR